MPRCSNFVAANTKKVQPEGVRQAADYSYREARINAVNKIRVELGEIKGFVDAYFSILRPIIFGELIEKPKRLERRKRHNELSN